jgi:hypothetical protein
MQSRSWKYDSHMPGQPAALFSDWLYNISSSATDLSIYYTAFMLDMNWICSLIRVIGFLRFYIYFYHYTTYQNSDNAPATETQFCNFLSIGNE